MTEVKMSSRVNLSPDKLWDVIGGFNALPDWHPAIEKSELEQGGTTRRLHLVGGGEIVEKLVKSDSDEHLYTYSIVSSPLPVANYTSTVRVTPDGDGAKVEWSGNFEPSGAPEPDAVKAIQGIYQAGFDNLRKMFGG